MPRNEKLLTLSREVIEPYVINVISHRPKVLKAYQSSRNDDIYKKIDGYVEVESGDIIPIQIKTRTINSNNFSISTDELLNTNDLKVFCFVDKTYDEDTINREYDLFLQGKYSVESLINENVKVYASNQENLINTIKERTNDCKYFLVNKNSLQQI